ncbi:MAG: alpha/beta fold hydrolase [Spirosomataceae bacterium]
MPVLSTFDYTPPIWLPNGHFQTIYPSVFRKVHGVNYIRERIATPDNDFLDLDWSLATPSQQTVRLVILSHGLEGDSHRQYILGMVKLLNHNGFDCLAWNYRGCSGEVNRQLRFYHSGATDDLDWVVRHALGKGYGDISMIGFSLGGNQTLKFLGENAAHLYPQIRRAVTFSVPLHLSSGSTKLERWQNWIYTERFNRSLKKKVADKAALMPDKIDTSYLKKIVTLRDFDNYYTSRLHGFTDAEDYYTRNSSLFFVDHIQVPTLIVNAQNDPFLATESFPFAQLKAHPSVCFEAPAEGGHCGFWPRNYQGFLWSEQRALRFLEAQG